MVRGLSMGSSKIVIEMSASFRYSNKGKKIDFCSKMKYPLIFISFTLSLCEANRLLCQLFNEQTKTLEQYCENFQGIIPANCTRASDLVDSLGVNQVEVLRVGGCNEFICLDAIERYNQIHTFDISLSHYTSLDWLDSSSFKLEKLKKFNASHNGISSIMMLLQNTPEATEIDLSHNKLTNINSSTFGRVDKLVKIHLSNNAIKTVEDGTFTNSSDLEFIDFNDNLLRSIPVLTNNKKLNTIHIIRNRISGFNYCIYAKMRSVSIYFSLKDVTSFYRDENCEGKQLEPLQVIRDNKHEGVLFTNGNYEIHCNDESFQNLYTFIAGRKSYVNVMDLLHYFGRSMTTIDLAGNLIGKLSTATFARFNDLSILILCDTHLKDFDFNVLTNQYYGLKVLDISNNNLKYIKNTSLLQHFHGLQEFNVAENQLQNTPEIIQHLRSSIEQLNLSANFVGRLNATSFERLTALKALNLSKTSLFMPNSNPFAALRVLRVLDISQNSLRNVNFAVLSSTLSKLNKFYASECEIENVSELISCLGTSIEELDLSGNSFMRMMNVRAFETLINLEYLNLSNTNIFHFDFNALKHQPLIQKLDISNNQLQEVNFESLISHLSGLYLEGNDLTKVDYLNRIHFPQLNSLSISRNLLSCDQVKQITSDWRGSNIIGDPLAQKNGDCGSRTQAVSDFFTDVYDKIKFW